MARASITVINLLCLLVLCRANESPQYEVVHVESDFEIRHYRDATWMSAVVNDLSFQKATLFGFHRLFQFIQGANLNYSRVAMTSPVVTSLVPGVGPLHSSAYVVRFYLPAKFQDSPPTPLPELNLRPYTWDSHYVAVRKFSGFATDDTVVKEAENLATSLSLSPWANSTTTTDYTYSVAQYDPPFRFFSRLNEVWVDVEASIFAGKASF
ncbi:cytosolic heme (tetrapyrrole) binding protein 1, haem-binding protein 1 [Hibiscus trionum]|uniref:Cytosolic heme (Tetrapyrrole) binding protein 1, haem-binding protein 1 n=1 Tax=Hibiscus trionum TaxID=183268 RepID=A0A9W7JE46_HIBTR|nr:cytosolic heme (tetrapyrrole) binding protein 1, haem-binding protein 1 [Hibiscus trionum]